MGVGHDDRGPTSVSPHPDRDKWTSVLRAVGGEPVPLPALRRPAPRPGRRSCLAGDVGGVDASSRAHLKMRPHPGAKIVQPAGRGVLTGDRRLWLIVHHQQPGPISSASQHARADSATDSHRPGTHKTPVVTGVSCYDVEAGEPGLEPGFTVLETARIAINSFPQGRRSIPTPGWIPSVAVTRPKPRRMLGPS
jgi:hypothetical protein